MTVCLATGGHPLPLVLRAGGRSRPPARRARCSGILDDPEITEHAVELAPGDALVLFTDGVTEATAADRAAGPGRLVALLAGLRGRGRRGDRRGRRARRARGAGRSARDDVAVLVARAAARRGRWPARRRG